MNSRALSLEQVPTAAHRHPHNQSAARDRRRVRGAPPTAPAILAATVSLGAAQALERAQVGSAPPRVAARAPPRQARNRMHFAPGEVSAPCAHVRQPSEQEPRRVLRLHASGLSEPSMRGPASAERDEAGTIAATVPSAIASPCSSSMRRQLRAVDKDRLGRRGPPEQGFAHLRAHSRRAAAAQGGKRLPRSPRFVRRGSSCQLLSARQIGSARASSPRLLSTRPPARAPSTAHACRARAKNVDGRLRVTPSSCIRRRSNAPTLAFVVQPTHRPARVATRPAALASSKIDSPAEFAADSANVAADRHDAEAACP